VSRIIPQGPKRILALGFVIFVLCFGALALAASGHAATPESGTYPLTATIQWPLPGKSVTVKAIVTVTNNSKTLRFAPLFFLDRAATLVRSSSPTTTAISKLTGEPQTVWAVPKLKPGQSATFTVWYKREVDFPAATDPSGYTYPPAVSWIGGGYSLSFSLYDSYYKITTIYDMGTNVDFCSSYCGP